MNKVSVLISVCNSDNAGFFDEAMASMIVFQTKSPSQVVLVCDGQLDIELLAVIDKWKSLLGDDLEVIRLSENVGLAVALNIGLEQCRHELVARMDADDISMPNRLQLQLDYLSAYSDVAVLGGQIEEVDSETLATISYRLVPATHEDILKLSKLRNPISHPTVMFRRQCVKEVGGYPPFRKMQDFALWSLMLKRGFRFANLQDVVLKMRAGNALLGRRGLFYLKNELKVISFQRQIGHIGYGYMCISMLVRIVVRLSPTLLKRVFYSAVRR